MKRIISLICVLAMLAVCAAVPSYAAAETDIPVLIGYQYSNVYQNAKGEDVRNIRFIAAGNDVTYCMVGFEITAPEYEKTWSGASATVYQTLNAVGNDGNVAKISAQTYGAQYLFAYVVKGVPANADIAFDVKAYAVDANGNNVNGAKKHVIVAKTAAVPSGPVYPIPADAVDYTIGGEVFTVIRTLAELKSALSVSKPNTRLILANDIDGNGEKMANLGLEVGAGSVIEGNNCTVSNITGASIFNLENGAEIVIRNLQFGTEAAPLNLAGALMAGYTNCISRWENVSVYANLTADGGDIAVWYGKANGTHTFINCSVTATVVDTGKGNAGAWVGMSERDTNSWTFDGCNIYGSVQSNNNAGGLMGYMGGSIIIKNCTNYANITGGSYAGGFVAHMTKTTNSTEMENCVNQGSITGTGGTGGLMGTCRKSATITNCTNFSTINGKWTGGLIGYTEADNVTIKITACTNSGSVTGSEHAGGLLGWAFTGNHNVEITASINNGAVTAAVGKNAGGIAGCSSVTGIIVSACLNAGNVKGGFHIAGMVGQVTAGTAKFTKCANIGNISCDSARTSNNSASNICGYLVPAGGTVTDCYGFGKLDHTKIQYKGIMLCQYSRVQTASGNKYVEFGNTATYEFKGITDSSSQTMTLDANSKVATLEEAVNLLEERFADLDFEIVNGVIQIKTAN